MAKVELGKLEHWVIKKTTRKPEKAEVVKETREKKLKQLPLKEWMSLRRSEKDAQKATSEGKETEEVSEVGKWPVTPKNQAGEESVLPSLKI